MKTREKEKNIASLRVTRLELFDRMFLLGPPGIGKSEIIEQLARKEAKELDKEFVNLRQASIEKIRDIIENPQKYYVFLQIMCPHILPEDISVPNTRELLTGSEYYKVSLPLFLYIFTLNGIHGTLFLNEITNVQRSDQITLYFSLFNEKIIGMSAKLSDNVKVVAAGNPSSWSSVANELPLPMRMGRMIILQVDPPTLEDWLTYMSDRYEDKWEQKVYLYLKLYPEDFLKQVKLDELKENEALACPRSWTRLALLLYELRKKGYSYNDPLVYEVARGLVGPRVAPQFISFLNTNISEEIIERIKKGDMNAYESLNETEKYLLIYMIVQKEPEEILKFKEFIKYIAKYDREYAALFLSFLSTKKVWRIIIDPEINKALSNLIEYIKIPRLIKVISSIQQGQEQKA